jgi:hypothetical protein
MLAMQVERCPARHQNLQRWARREEITDDWRGLNHVLEVVQNQEDPPKAKVRSHRFLKALVARLPEAEFSWIGSGDGIAGLRPLGRGLVLPGEDAALAPRALQARRSGTRPERRRPAI